MKADIQPELITGCPVSFELEEWREDLARWETTHYTVPALGVIQDPLGHHESKIKVMVNGEDYNIPISEITDYRPKIFFQPTLF